MEKQVNYLLAIASLMLGIFGLVAWLLPICGVPISITALVFGFVGKDSLRSGMAKAGIVMAILGLVLGIGNAALGAYTGFKDGNLLAYRPSIATNAGRIVNPATSEEITYYGVKCTHYSNISYNQLGLNICVYGVIKAFGPFPTSWNTIDFGPSKTGIRIVDLNGDHTSPLILGACVRVYGKMYFERNNPYIVPDKDAKDSISLIDC